MKLYLDASVMVPLILTERSSETMHAWIAGQDGVLCAGQLAIGEVGSAVSRRRRMNLLTAAEGDRALAAFDAWQRGSVRIIEHDAADIRQAALWVRQPIPKLLMPDAIHLATCKRLRLSLITGDSDLTTVADVLEIDWIAPTRSDAR